MKIILTGGHLTPAYSLAELAREKGDQLLLISAQGPDSTEVTELGRLGVEYRWIKSVKYDRYHRLRSILTMPGIIASTLQAALILKSYKPDVVVTFGSFNAVPVALAAKIARIPYITHEQTKSIGLANSIIAGGASACAVSYDESLPNYPPNKTTLVGNLLRKTIWQPPTTAPFSLPSSKPILYVTGGNQGSETIIQAVLSVVDQLTDKYQLILQHGHINPFLSHQIKPLVIARSWFNVDEAAWLLHHARIVISRGGANTTSELMVAGVPAVIIPLEGSAGNEQMTNAKVFSDHSAGIVLHQKKCSGDTLLDSINQLETDYDLYLAHAKQLISLQHRDAATKLYQLATVTPSSV